MKFRSKPIEEHVEVPLADDGQWEKLVQHWTEREGPQRPAAADGNRCFVLSVSLGKDEQVEAAQLSEICGLVEAQGDTVVGQEIHRLTKADPRTLVRPGVAERVGTEARDEGADLLVVDAELSPSQTRNLEDATGLPVSDREAVILNVFERHATTPRARIQVEIAHLQYLRPRIRGIGLNMDQQAGGIMGSRGAGETASELFARRLDGRLADLRRRLVRLKRAGHAQRKQRAGCDRIALVGYTNAGKTSLMNALTAAGLSVRNRPFETLDTTSRCLTRHGGDVLISDTVGFIRRLPERLFASFESTLAEAAEASLLVLVVDASDPERAAHLQTTDEVLTKLGAASIPRFIVFNKIDRLALDTRELRRLAGVHPFAALSARDSAAVDALRSTLLRTVRRDHEVRDVFVPYERADVVNLIYAKCRVQKVTATDTGTQFVLEGPHHVVTNIVRQSRRPS
ncbi:MAG: GTPase HflX [Myxococcota bacterium]